MTPEEKWSCLTNPKVAGDYGLSLTEAELETFPAGQEILAEVRQLRDTEDAQCRLVAELGKNAADFVAQLRHKIFTAAIGD
jgi:hypothetical protein